MKFAQSTMVLMIVFGVFMSVAAPQNPPAGGGRGAPATAPGPQRGGRGGGGRGGVQIMTLSTTAWPDGGQIPVKYTQAGDQVSPALTWSNVPEGTESFVLLFHDVNAAIANGTDDIMHWLLWNIPKTATSVPEGVPQGFQLPDGTRQISASGPYYRGPGAPAAGPVHHYVFELFALDITLNAQPVAQVPGVSVAAETRANVFKEIAGHIRGKAVYSGLFRRAP